MFLKNLWLSYKINTKNKKNPYYTFTYFFFNHLANLLISILLVFKIRPNTFTYINIIISVLQIYFIFLFNEQALKIGVTLYFVSLLADKCDGGLARIYKFKTFYGKYLDGLNDIVGRALFFYGLGLNVLILNPNKNLEIFFVISILFFVIDNFILDRYSAIARWCNEENKSNISPTIKHIFFFQVISNILKQDVINIIIVLIFLTPPGHNFNTYYLLFFSVIFILMGVISILSHSISARNNFDLSKK